MNPGSESNPLDAPPDPEREFRAAVIALSREPGFRLNAALFRSRAVRDRTQERLRLALAEDKILLTTLDLRERPTHQLLAELEQHLAAHPTPAGQRRAIAVLGLEDRLGLAIAGLPGGEEERTLLHTANLHRDAFPRICPCPILLWVTDGAFRELVRQAPDLWHWRAHTFQFTEAEAELSDKESQATGSIRSSGVGLPYRDFQEREEALALFRTTLRNYEATGQGETTAACAVRDRISNILYDLGRFADAEPLVCKNLAIRERTLGADHRDTLASVNNKALLLYAKRDLAGAEPLFRRAIIAQKRKLGPEHIDTLVSLSNLAGLLRKKGDWAGAESLLRQTLEVYERTLGPGHHDTLVNLNNLAAVLQSKGDLEEAEMLYRRALDTSERKSGMEHAHTLESLNNLATLLRRKGDLAGAEQLYRRALAVMERMLGPEHPSTLTSLSNLARLLYARRDLSGAEALIKRAAQGFQATLGPEHPDTQSAMNALTLVRRAQLEKPL